MPVEIPTDHLAEFGPAVETIGCGMDTHDAFAAAYEIKQALLQGRLIEQVAGRVVETDGIELAETLG